jgi:crotonobetainyl-CoA:carnitine CoA-transferase CaiB-like acyl-CoA transferase
VKDREHIEQIAQENFLQRPWSEWKQVLQAAGVPAGEVRTVSEALMSDEARERGIVTRIPHAVAGWLPNVALPLRMSKTPMADPVAAPALGQHTVEVLTELLDLQPSDLRRLREAGTIFQDPSYDRA